MSREHTLHHLKTTKPYFDDLWIGTKTFEIRKNDRDFKIGDYLILEEYFDNSKTYSGNCIDARIQHILHEFVGLKPDYVVMSIKIVARCSKRIQRLEAYNG